MKNYIKKLIVFYMLSTSSITLSMEEKQPASLKRKYGNEETNQERPIKNYIVDENNSVLLKDLGLPIKIWNTILEDVYFNPSIFDEANDIYEGITAIEEHIHKCYRTISLVCKAFRELNSHKDRRIEFKEKIRKFYIPRLNERFLERRQSKEGLYPKNNEWNTDDVINNDIARFISTGIMSNHRLLFDIILHSSDNIVSSSLMNQNAVRNNNNFENTSPKSIKLKLMRLLLFYGANPNIKSAGATPLHCATFEYYMRQYKADLIKLLLNHGANPNATDLKGDTPLHCTLFNHSTIRNYSDIITILLKCGANPDIKNSNGKTVFDIAKEKKFFDFPQLVREHARIC